MLSWTHPARIGLAAAALLLASTAAAFPIEPFIDFRSDEFEDADEQDDFETIYNGIHVRIEAFQQKGVEGEIFWDKDEVDGIAVDGGVWEDEIDEAERLVITFPNEDFVLTEIFVTDLFPEELIGAPGEEEPEFGFYVLAGEEKVKLDGELSTESNGEQIFSVPDAPLVSKITFYVNKSHPKDYTVNSDFSIAGLNGLPIPEPGAPLVFAASLAAVSVVLRRRRGQEVDSRVGLRAAGRSRAQFGS